MDVVLKRGQERCFAYIDFGARSGSFKYSSIFHPVALEQFFPIKGTNVMVWWGLVVGHHPYVCLWYHWYTPHDAISDWYVILER
jgi:hypothetical protein